jgi:hypothetical protein
MLVAKILQAVLFAAALGAFFDLARRSARRPATRDPLTGELVLQFGPFLIWTMGGIAVLGPLGMAILSFVIPFKNEREVYIPIALGLFFLLLGGFLFVYLSRRRTRVSKDGLTSEYLFARPAHMAWDEVERVKLSGNQELFLYDRDGRRVWFHIFLVGVKEAVPLLREHLPAAVQRSNEETLKRFATAAGAEPRGWDG